MSHFFASLPNRGLFAAPLGRLLTQIFAGGDESVPGTTEGVLLMGVLIVLIILLPIIIERRRWMR